MSITQIERQRDVLKAIAIEISEVHQLMFDSVGLVDQSIIADSLLRIKEIALSGVKDHEAVEKILHGYRTDCLSKLVWLHDACARIVCGGFYHVRDESLQELALAASGFAGSVEKYLALKNGAAREVDHG